MAKLYCSSDAKIVVKIKHQLLFLLKIPICHSLIKDEKGAKICCFNIFNNSYYRYVNLVLYSTTYINILKV